MCSNHCEIDAFIGDNPKRSIARNSKTHSSYYPCEYCEAKGQLLNNEDSALRDKKIALQKQKESLLDRLYNARALNDEEETQSLNIILKTVEDSLKSMNRKNNNIVWPSSSMNGKKRTSESVVQISDRIEEGENLSLDESKGIVGRSLFLDIPYFNIVEGFNVEYLHGVCLGVVKRTVALTFNVGENRQRNTTRKLSTAESFNILICKVKVTRDFSRRARALDFSVMKGQEFRNIILVFFPLVIKCIPEEAGERRLWLVLAYMVRASILPNDEYENIDRNVVAECGREFYVLFEELFGSRNCTYYLHSVCSHINTMRVHGPLTMTSAFGFESFYGEMRHSFAPGTVSPLKQIFEKILLKRAIAPHSCRPNIYYSPKDSAMESNSLVYTFNDNEYNFFKIVDMDEDSLHCNKIEKAVASFPETPTLAWTSVGVFKAGEITDEAVTLNKSNVSGKFLEIDDLFITCPINVLEEK